MPVPSLDQLSEESRREVEQMLRGGNKIAAIKRVRLELQVGLKEAKEAVESHMTALGISSTGSGCLLLIATIGTALLLGLAIA